MLEVKSIIVSAGVESTIEFNKKHSLFLIKNFSSAPIRVSLGEQFNADNSIRINSGSYEELSNESIQLDRYNKVSILPDGDGEVEIQCLE